MANPLRQLKYLPWTSLVIITGVTFAWGEDWVVWVLLHPVSAKILIAPTINT